MKLRTLGVVSTVLIGVALSLAIISSAFAQQPPNGPGWGPGGMMGGGGPGGGYGPGYGPGMMGGYGYGYGPGQAQQATPLSGLDDAKVAFQRYVDATGNKNLALDEVMQFQFNYYAIIKDTTTGNGAFELLADPRSGAVFPEYGPNMMWNTQYGMMAGYGGRGYGGMMGGYWGQPQAQPTVDAAKAQQIALQWLDQFQPGSGTEAPDTFPGYYTLHITKDGTITGMLSVNAYTGQVWYHTWHGAFVAMTEPTG